jgi:multidrug efflux pump
VNELTSYSSLGSTRVTLQFDLSRDINGAARDVQAAINASRALLPTGMPSNPSYRKVNPADAPILILALTSKNLSRGQLYDVASTLLSQRLSQVDGVGQVTIGGGALPAVRIEIDPAKLASQGLSLEDVRTAVAATNANRPKGQVEDAQRSWQIGANDQASRADDYTPLVLRYRDGRAVRLGDVAQVSDSVQDVRNYGVSNGERLLGMSTENLDRAEKSEYIDALLARGASPDGPNFIAQYQVPRCFQSGDAKPVYKKGKPATLDLEFTALEDLSAANELERFGLLVSQHQAPL